MAEKVNSFPAISAKNWWLLRERFKATLPNTFSETYVVTLLKMANDNSARSNVISPMKRVGLIDQDNKPTSLDNEWRLDEKYKEVCTKIINSVYPQELLDLFPDTNVDINVASSWFMRSGIGKAAAVKMATFFAMLKNGEIADLKTKPVNKKDNTISKRAKHPSKSNLEIESEKIPTKNNSEPEKQKAGIITRPNLHIDLQIHISPDSTSEQIECIFASMAKHLYGATD